jgi:hypothetical protein
MLIPARKTLKPRRLPPPTKEQKAATQRRRTEARANEVQRQILRRLDAIDARPPREVVVVQERLRIVEVEVDPEPGPHLTPSAS